MKTKSIKYFNAVLIAILLFGLNLSCDKAKKYIGFDVDYKLPKVSFSYPSSMLKSGDSTLYEGQFSFNLDSLLTAHSIPAGVISSATFSRFEITITSPPEANIGWLQSLNVIASPSSTFQPSVVLGNAIVTDSTAKTLLLTLNNVNLQPYLNGTSFHYRITGILNGPFPYSMVVMLVNAEVKVRVEPL